MKKLSKRNTYTPTKAAKNYSLDSVSYRSNVLINRNPLSLSDYIGNDKIKQIIQITIDACNEKNLLLGHILITGPRGTGKTTLATLIAKELGLTYKIISANAIETLADLNDLFLFNLPQLLAIDEIHNIKPAFSDMMHSIMDSFEYSYSNEDGHIVTVPIKHFTLIGMTTSEGKLTVPFHSRFVKKYHLMPYTPVNLQKIVMNVAENNDVEIDNSAAYEIAVRSNGIPRNAILQFQNVYEYAIKFNKGIINHAMASAALNLHEIDPKGLGMVQREILKALSRATKPLGAANLCQRIGIDMESLINIYEPYLLSIQFVERKSTGRVITQTGLAHLNKNKM